MVSGWTRIETPGPGKNNRMNKVKDIGVKEECKLLSLPTYGSSLRSVGETQKDNELKDLRLNSNVRICVPIVTKRKKEYLFLRRGYLLTTILRSLWGVST